MQTSVLVGRPEGKRALGRPRCRWNDNIKMDLKVVVCDARNYMNLAQNRDQSRATVWSIINFRISEKPISLSECVCVFQCKPTALLCASGSKQF